MEAEGVKAWGAMRRQVAGLRAQAEGGSVQKIDGSGKVHIGRPLREANGLWSYVVIACTGRAMRGMVYVSGDVTCKACRRKAEA